MVGFGNQLALLFLDTFPLSDVHADADDSVRAPLAVERNEAARLDPTHLATWAIDAILHAIFAPARPERVAAGLLHPRYVVGMHAGQAFAPCNLGSSLG